MQGQLTHDKLRTLLLDTGVIAEKDLALAEERVKSEGGSLTQALLWYNFISDEQLGRLVADHLHFPFVALIQETIPGGTLALISEVVARRHRVIAFRETKQGLDVAMLDPANLELANFLERKIGLPIRRFYATEHAIEETLSLYHTGAPQAIEDLLSISIDEAKRSSTEATDPPVTRIVDTLFQYAHQNRASDIHLEPREEDALVRFRIDGVLHDIVKVPRPIHVQMVSHIKVRSGLRTDEHQVPQDGKLRAKTESEDIDIRISVIPIIHGEKVVLRLLSDRSRQFALNNLGLGEADLQKVEAAYHRPYGMILVTGPTGCGKTTSLYSFLKLLNRRNVNIVTIEDPVEYDIEGVNQIQVNPAANLTFATGIRSILRQDPNVILVGEIRDNETARIAVNLAMTGHLVLSTLHTNNAATAIPRLLDMSIEPFLIASTINVVIAQRLVRTIHTNCRVSEEIPRVKLVELLGETLTERLLKEETTLRAYRGKGCDGCHGTGYQGRTGIFEVMELNEAVRQAITRSATANEIHVLAQEGGMATMQEDGLAKVMEGVTTLEEIIRATEE